MKGGTPMVFFEGVGIILQTCWAILTALVESIPSLMKIAGIKTEIIAAALGIPVIALTLIKFTIKGIKFLKKI